MHKLTRRHVLATFAGATVTLCPAILNAQSALDLWGQEVADTQPFGQKSVIEVGEGAASIDVTDLTPGDVAVISRPTDNFDYERLGFIQHIAVLRRTDAQIAVAPAGDQDPRYFVADLLCPHRGFAIGITDNPDMPFACTKRGDRHSSMFDSTGLGVAGKSTGDPMSVPSYTMDITGDGQAITQAILNLN